MAGASLGAPSQDGEANTSRTQKPSVVLPPPMTSDDLMSLTSPRDVTVGGNAVVTPQAATVRAMPDMNDLLGFSSTPEPAVPFTASFPDATQSSLIQTGGSSAAAQGAGWCDFSNFSPTPVPMTMQTGTPANTPLAQSAVSSPCVMHAQNTPSTLNNTLGEFDFADFVSASPTQAATLTSSSPAHLTSTPFFAEGQRPTNNPMPTVPSMPTAWAAPAPLPVVPIANPAASSLDSLQAGGQPVPAPAPAGKSSGEAANDLSAMLSQQVNLLDLT